MPMIQVSFSRRPRRVLASSLVLLGLLSPLAAQSAPPPDMPWARVRQAAPSVRDVPDARLRARIAASGLPWCVVDVATGIEMLLVPAGRFEREPAEEPFERQLGRLAAGEVIVAAPLYVGRFEVRNAELRTWRAKVQAPRPLRELRVADKDEAAAMDRLVVAADDQPAVFVSWSEARAFCAESGFRLPTESEWEYFARAGMATDYPWGADPAQGVGHANVLDVVTREQRGLDGEAFPFDDEQRGIAPVGRFRANGFGLFDVIGNVSEWCELATQAELGGDDQAAAPPFRVCRGGSWMHGPGACRLNSRNGFGPDDQTDVVGFRVVREAGAASPSASSGR